MNIELAKQILQAHGLKAERELLISINHALFLIQLDGLEKWQAYSTYNITFKNVIEEIYNSK